jgi:2-alkyl-3-oxoalkanoate reductase
VKLLITGAGGFLGKYVVAEAVARGHEIRALVRPTAKEIPEAWQAESKVEVVRADLRSASGLERLVDQIDTVIHLAAAKSGDLYEQFGGTVIATENLLSALKQKGTRRLVVTSSFSVYEYLRRWSWGRMDENSPLAVQAHLRDEYSQTKLQQERLVQEFCEAHSISYTLLRPGVIFGRDNLWTARLGMQLSNRLWIRTGAWARLPLTYVENCAEAILLAAEYTGTERELKVNIVDDNLPTQRAYLKALQCRMKQPPWVLPISWSVMRVSARSAWLSNRLFFGGSAKVPGLFVPSRLHARCKPLRYSNERAKDVLGWSPRYTWEQGLERSCSEV